MKQLSPLPRTCTYIPIAAEQTMANSEVDNALDPTTMEALHKELPTTLPSLSEDKLLTTQDVAMEEEIQNGDRGEAGSARGSPLNKGMS